MSFLMKNIQRQLVVISMIVLAGANVVPVAAQQAPTPDAPITPGIINGTGTSFAVTNSDWLNVTLNSSVPIYLSLTSSPKIITMRMGTVTGATSTDITLGGLEANTTYWRYDDNSLSGVSINADASGNYTFTQDLTVEHSIRIQAGKSTYNIFDDGSGGNCTLIGTWNSATKTCTLTQNVTDSIYVYTTGITLDGAGFRVVLPSWGYVQINGDRQTVKNLTIQGVLDSNNNPTGYGIYLNSASNSTVTNVTALDTYYGVYSYSSYSNTIQRSVFTGQRYGAYSSYGNSNTFTDNVFSGATGGGYYGFFTFAGNASLIQRNTFSGFSYGVLFDGYYDQIYYCYYYNGWICNWYYYNYTSSNNTVYRNSFVNVVTPIYVTNGNSQTYYNSGSGWYNYTYRYFNYNSGNRFNLGAPDGGNYYSQFDTPAEGCSDNNSDGFCDVAFSGVGAVDNLPWITQNGWASQTIVFGALPNRTFGDPSFTVSAAASSGLPVAFSSVGSCSVSGNTVTIIQAGNCTITANQSGNIYWNPAPPVSQSFTINQATTSVTLSCPAAPQTYTGSAQTPCSATYSTSDGLTGSLTVSYTNNLNAGLAGASATYAGDANHAGSSKTGSFTISQATPVITWSNPATIVYGTPLSGTQLNATASVSGSFVYTPPSGTILNAGNGQTLHVDFTPADTTNYYGVSKDVSIDVFFAKPILEWNNPADIEYGTALSAVQLNATADVPGTFTYTPSAGTVLNAGMNQILQVSFQPDNPNYTGKSTSVYINVYKSAPKLQITSPSSGKAGQQVNEGDPPITAAAFSNSDAPITFTAGPPQVCTSSGPDGSTITIVGFGLCTVTATQEESSNYGGASTSVSFYVNGRPVANAGSDQTLNESSFVLLDGTASQDPEADNLTYAWTQVAGTAVALDNPAAAQPTFTTPSVTYLQDGSVLTFKLIVNDGQLDSLPAIVNVTVKNVNKIPVALASTLAPAVNEGSPGLVLKGSDSYDPDGEALIYSWLQTSGPAVTLSDPSTANPTFNAPLVGQAGALLAFQLTVSDPLGASATDTVNIQVANVNQAPTANAGTNQTVNENTLVTLDGTASSDPDNDALGFSWSQVAGTSVTLSANNVGKPTFTAPDVGPGGETLSFKLTVDDGLTASGESYVNVLVQNVNDPPVCSAARPNLAVLWPPNHKMIPISILGVTDPNNNQVAITITGVTQDEPVSGLGDGDTRPDAVIQGGQLLLRAERAGNANGRVYRVAFTADDGNGGNCGGIVYVSVPRDMKPGNAAVDSGQTYNSTQP